MSRETRVEALEALYAADAIGELPALVGVSRRAGRLAEAAWEARADLDAEISAAATGWRLKRMPAVDRAILRLALYELRHTETPIGVVISQAVDLAKEFSTQRSGAFINGVLANLADAGDAE